MRVKAFTRYGRSAASTRQRLLQYMPALAEAGIAVEHHALLDNDYVRSLATGERYPKRRLARAYAERMRQLLGERGSEVIWIYAELFPYLPAGFERLAFRSGKPVVYDFDDAFFHQYDENPRSLVRKLLGGKLQPLLKAASVCCCGNAYLRDYALPFCPDSIVLPTVVDTDECRPRETGPSDPLVIGWIGSPSTWCNVQPILPVLAELVRERGVRVRAIGAGTAAAADAFPGLELIDWSEETEVEEVRNMDVGIMPLLDLPFQRGKSGYKLIQYMACGLPAVASPVGVNAEIVREGESGYLAASEQDWREALIRLIEDPALRAHMGAAGRRRAVEAFSLASQAPRLVDVFRRAAIMPAKTAVRSP